MVTGGYPFETTSDANLLDLYEKIIHADFVAPTHLPEDLQELLTQMLVKNPSNRADLVTIGNNSWSKQSFPLSETNQPLKYAYPPTKPDMGTNGPTSPVSNSISPLSQGLGPPRTLSPTNADTKSHRNSIFHFFSKGTMSPIRPEAHKCVTPVTTTLTSYLEELFAEEIEQELIDAGTIDQLCFDTDELGTLVT